MEGWVRILAGLAFGALVAILARLMLRVIFDVAAYADRFDAGLFVLGTLIVTVVMVTAASASLPASLGAALLSTGSILGSWMGLRFAADAPATDAFGRLIDELRATLNESYLDAGAVVISGAFVAIAIVRLRISLAAGRQ
ncbi:MAG: hypothetical protein M3P14_12455 [Chloroflexota bacterium]|nr:hypothetical protein [Chloroflexota bacterium]